MQKTKLLIGLSALAALALTLSVGFFVAQEPLNEICDLTKVNVQHFGGSDFNFVYLEPADDPASIVKKANIDPLVDLDGKVKAAPYLWISVQAWPFLLGFEGHKTAILNYGTQVIDASKFAQNSAFAGLALEAETANLEAQNQAIKWMGTLFALGVFDVEKNSYYKELQRVAKRKAEASTQAEIDFKTWMISQANTKRWSALETSYKAATKASKSLANYCSSN